MRYLCSWQPSGPDSHRRPEELQAMAVVQPPDRTGYSPDHAVQRLYYVRVFRQLLPDLQHRKPQNIRARTHNLPEAEGNGEPEGAGGASKLREIPQCLLLRSLAYYRGELAILAVQDANLPGGT